MPQARPAPGPGHPPNAVEAPRPATQAERAPQPEGRELSRAPRRVAPSGPDPLQARGRDQKPKDDKSDKDKKDKSEKGEKK